MSVVNYNVRRDNYGSGLVIWYTYLHIILEHDVIQVQIRRKHL